MSRSFLKRLFESEDTRELHDRIEALEKRMRSVEEDWTEVYNKFRTLQMRVAKQVQRLDANSSQEEPQGAEGDEVAPTNAATSLSPRLQRIQREIMERRQRKIGAPQGGE